jgi:hypothetical protein
MSHYPVLKPAGQWAKHAACREPGIHPDEMFPDNNEHAIAHAKQICKPCPVQTECVLDALRTRDLDYGIRGGLRPKELRNLARQVDAGQRAEQAKQVEAEPAPKKKPQRTFLSLWNQHSRPLSDGHASWTGPTPVSFQGHYYTPTQIAFRVDRKRPPVGIVRRTCAVDGCVLPAHLMDQQERDAQDLCGSRPGYQRHLKRGEEPCGPCRRANTDADNRLRRTGTSKVAA